MSFFNLAEPPLRRKQDALDVQDQTGLWQLRWQIGQITLLSRFYTRVDQIFVIWGLITALIFVGAQFAPISWVTQAYLWSGLTLVGVVVMTGLAWFWVSVERLRWVVYSWAILMLLGVSLTDLSIFLSWWLVLMYLCPLWLGLSAIGYFSMGVGMRSRTFLLTGLIHLLAMGLVPLAAGWQFLATASVMAGSLLFLAEVQWDMRPPIDFSGLTLAQRQFNQAQHRLRQLQPQRST
ncbi:hypothetical protein IQ268_18455 [Oculatella sp. LEGE 06141]|uniref:hypothetical protein n=1 Tax=Oculatella sp. LEGE 06141 TaxID=1828648 RepID=UPI0018822E31|nr:hypothetical protein [Oculatella sp. LEGE 06141]MBE9180546.1 hypothetical protein [Oculatella sp. LEGE 06141]